MYMDNRYKSLMENQFDDDRHYMWIKNLSRVEGFSQRESKISIYLGSFSIQKLCF